MTNNEKRPVVPSAHSTAMQTTDDDLQPAIQRGESHSQPTSIPDAPRILSGIVERLIAQHDPNGPPHDPTLLMVRKRCGEWLTWQRIRSNITPTDIVIAANLGPRGLCLLELGLATDTDVPARMIERLARRLADDIYTADWIAAVIDAALGNFEDLEAEMLYQIEVDLRYIHCEDKPLASKTSAASS